MQRITNFSQITRPGIYSNGGTVIEGLPAWHYIIVASEYKKADDTWNDMRYFGFGMTGLYYFNGSQFVKP